MCSEPVTLGGGRAIENALLVVSPLGLVNFAFKIFRLVGLIHVHESQELSLKVLRNAGAPARRLLRCAMPN